ncbi:hypothetical protein PGT21_031723 [Puccinia graminis f. sp. tritici]|uniref:Uncharacterized protein n=1 Tax=Puccinia graminis f. sp. tritici TaxID=56615 RepID=A0A5B0N8U9_PUCGR|nr:hypothetical protein PGT21_031723 [Puccinia graminis f. sp. tritici]
MENNKSTRSKTYARKEPVEAISSVAAENIATIANPTQTKVAEFSTAHNSSDPHDSDEEGSVDLIAKIPETAREVILNTSIPPAKDLAAKRSLVWTKLKEAQASGDKLLSKILLKAYNELEDTAIDGPPKMTQSISALPVLTNMSEELSIAKTIVNATETELEDNLVYAVGTVTNHQDIGFTPYFDDNIKKLKAPLPLTIFDREWQKKALTAHLMLKLSKNSEATKLP